MVIASPPIDQRLWRWPGIVVEPAVAVLPQEIGELARRGGVAVPAGTLQRLPGAFGGIEMAEIEGGFTGLDDKVQVYVVRAAAAQEIATVVESLNASLATSATRWEQGRVDSGGTGGGIPERFARVYAENYLPWARWMSDRASAFAICKGCARQYAKPIGACTHCGSQRLRREQPHLALVLSVAVYGAGLKQCAEVYRMRGERALRLLKAGLQRYDDFG